MVFDGSIPVVVIQGTPTQQMILVARGSRLRFWDLRFQVICRNQMNQETSLKLFNGHFRNRFIGGTYHI